MTTATDRPHLAYIDGLRGLAALFVTVHHALAECIDSGYNHAVTGRVPSHIIVWLYNGEVSVQVFLVLSGYCLMIPVARSGGAIRGGLAEFARRRAWRILPTYYAALAICLLLPALVPALRASSGPLRWRATQPVTAPALVSHLLMVHHLSADWAYRIDYPMWSIPIEWWLYGLFALILVPLWRKLGVGMLAVSTVALGLALSWWAGPDYESMRLHYLSLFGLGMAGAAINFGSKAGGWSARMTRASGGLAVVAAVALVVLRRVVPNDEWSLDLRLALACGVATAALLVWATARLQAGASSPLIGSLEHPAMAWLGRISYSLYLIHAPTLALIHLAVIRLGLGPIPSLAAVMTGGVAASLLAGWGLWIAVERWAVARMGRPKRNHPQMTRMDADKIH